MDLSIPRFTVAEYFAGIGLVRMGLQPHGWQVVFANDISEKKHEMYKDFFPDAKEHYLTDDIFKIDPDSIPPAYLATCSFPCIDLSLAGNMNGIVSGTHSSAFWGFIKILEAQNSSAPPLVLIENVPGWLYSNKGKDFRITIEALNRLGYACDVFILDARRFTPQSRLRVFVIGTKLPVPHTTAELILARPKSLLSDQMRKSIVSNKDLRWFYNEIPCPPPLRTDGLSKLIESMDDTDSRWWREDEVKRHFNMMSDLHKYRVQQFIQSETYFYRTFFRRRRQGEQRAEVRNDDLSGCLRTAVGGSGKQFLVRVGKGSLRMRSMTPREYARLQGVPDEYTISINGVQALTGFGDAVCVPVISWIAEHILNPLADYGLPCYSHPLPNSQLFLLEKHERQSSTRRSTKDHASRQEQGHQT
jgi:DNA (cytosine-5)-methyltransferase 1